MKYYIGVETRNEMIELKAHYLHHQFMLDFADALYYSVIADGTIGIIEQEQFSISIWYVHRDSHEIRKVLKIQRVRPWLLQLKTLFFSF